MVNILLERQRQERSLHEEMGPDRGSEAGDVVNVDDCMEFAEVGLFSDTKKSLCSVHGLDPGNEHEPCTELDDDLTGNSSL